MADYERTTVYPVRQVFETAHGIFPARAELERTREERHSVTYAGPEGTVVIDAHRHGLSTVVTVQTDRLRTSKVDGVVRHFLNQLPYQHGDPPRE